MEEKEVKKNDVKENLKNNKKTFIILGASVVASIALLAISSGWGDNPSEGGQSGYRQEQTGTSSDEWERLDAVSDPLRFPTTEETHSQSTADPVRPVPAPSPAESFLEEEPGYSAPSFVTSSRDTLIWEGGIYRKVGDVPKPKIPAKPDTLVIEGKKYIEIK